MSLFLFFFKYYKIGAQYSRITDLFIFPCNIIEAVKNFDLASSIIECCISLNLYSREKENSITFSKLKDLLRQALEKNHQSLLTALCRLDFRLFKDCLIEVLEYASEPFAIAALEMAFNYRMPYVLFNQDELPSELHHFNTKFPRHITDYPNFIRKYCELISIQNSAVLSGLFTIFIGSSSPVDKVMLFWTIKSANFTNEHSKLIMLCMQENMKNPWLVAAAYIAGKIFRIDNLPTISNEQLSVHPISLYCYLRTDINDNVRIKHDLIEFNTFDINLCHAVVPEYPKQSLSEIEKEIFRIGFITKNLSQLRYCFTSDTLTSIIYHVILTSQFVSNLKKPLTISDYCMELLFTTEFYESIRIKKAFNKAIDIIFTEAKVDLSYISLIIGSMPQEFIQEESFKPFEFILSNYDQELSIVNNNIFFVDVKKDDILLSLTKMLPDIYVQENFEIIYNSLPYKAITVNLLIILLSKLDIIENNIGSDENYTINVNRSYILKKNYITIFVSEYNPYKIYALAKFCHQNFINIPFYEVRDPGNINLLCIQVQANHADACNYLFTNVIFDKQNYKSILKALSLMHNISLYSDKLKKKLPKLIKLCDIEDSQAVCHLSKNLPVITDGYYSIQDPYFVHLLYDNTNLLEVKLNIISSINVTSNYIESYLGIIISLTNQQIEPTQLTRLIQSPIAKYFTVRIATNMFHQIAIYLSESNLDISMVCTVCNCLSSLYHNIRSSTKVSIIGIECIRKVTSMFFKIIAVSEPTLSHVRSLQKLYLIGSRVLTEDFQYYPIPSFISHLLHLRNEERSAVEVDTTVNKVIQNIVFPIFTKIKAEKINEISISLHETQRKLFRELYDKWRREIQYRGKI